MKNLRSILAALVVLLAATAAHAQQPTITATVPFSFAVGDRAYPAGNYLFKNDGAALIIRDADRVKTSVTLSHSCESATRSADTKLVFDTMGGYYFLRQIWVAGNFTGLELSRSRAEVRLAQNHVQQESIIVAANISR